MVVDLDGFVDLVTFVELTELVDLATLVDLAGFTEVCDDGTIGGFETLFEGVLFGTGVDGFGFSAV